MTAFPTNLVQTQVFKFFYFSRCPLAIHERGLGENHPYVATGLNNLAYLYKSQGRYSEAEPLYKRSLLISEEQLGADHPNTALSLNNLAELYRVQGRYSEAEPLYKRSLSIWEQQLGADHPNVASSLNNLAGLYWAQDRLDEGLDFLARGLEVDETNILDNIATLTESQQRDYLNTVAGSEDWIVSLHLQHLPTNSQASATALTTILRRKGRILDTLSNSLQRIRANAKPEDLARLDQLSQLHTQRTNLFNQGITGEQVQALETQMDDLQKQLAQNNPAFNLEPVTLEAIRNLLPPDAALVEFFQYKPYNPKAAQGEEYGEPRYAAYILTPQGDPVGIDLGEAQAIDPGVRAFHDHLEANNQGKPNVALFQVQQEAQALYQQLIAPLKAAIGNATMLLISPDSSLNLIPFEALMDESNTYLIQTHTLHYLTSGRDLVGFSRFTLSNDAAILVGNPAFSNSGETIAQAETRAIDLKNKIFPPLKNTQAEVEQISDLIPGEQQVYTQTNATEALLKTHDSPPFLHLATHGFFEDDKLTEADNPLLRSGLVFAGVKEGNSGRDSQGNLQDGILTALEVSGLDLTGTQLVVMSACQSGLGNVATGEGVYGLRRAFTLAGVQTQVMSLWQVADQATQAFMVSYYQNLQAGQPRGEAIRATQLSFLNGTEYNHPYYWSAFISSGNWQPLTLINN